MSLVLLDYLFIDLIEEKAYNKNVNGKPLQIPVYTLILIIYTPQKKPVI